MAFWSSLKHDQRMQALTAAPLPMWLALCSHKYSSLSNVSICLPVWPALCSYNHNYLSSVFYPLEIIGSDIMYSCLFGYIQWFLLPYIAGKYMSVGFCWCTKLLKWRFLHVVMFCPIMNSQTSRHLSCLDTFGLHNLVFGKPLRNLCRDSDFRDKIHLFTCHEGTDFALVSWQCHPFFK